MPVFAVQLAKLGQLSQRFDAFGNDVHAHVVCERNDRAHDFDVLGCFTDASDERAIDLKGVERKAVQITQRRIAGAKVVDAQLHSQGFQTLEELRGQLGVFHHHALSDLQFQVPRVYVSLFQYLLNLGAEIGLGDLFAGKVDAHEKLSMGRRNPLPLGELLARAL